MDGVFITSEGTSEREIDGRIGAASIVQRPRESQALNFLVDLCSGIHLWSWALGNLMEHYENGTPSLCISACVSVLSSICLANGSCTDLWRAGHAVVQYTHSTGW